MSLTVTYPNGQTCANPGDILSIVLDPVFCSDATVLDVIVNGQVPVQYSVTSVDGVCVLTFATPDLGLNAIPSVSVDIRTSSGNLFATFSYCQQPDPLVVVYPNGQTCVSFGDILSIILPPELCNGGGTVTSVTVSGSPIAFNVADVDGVCTLTFTTPFLFFNVLSAVGVTVASTLGNFQATFAFCGQPAMIVYPNEQICANPSDVLTVLLPLTLCDEGTVTSVSVNGNGVAFSRTPVDGACTLTFITPDLGLFGIENVPVVIVSSGGNINLTFDYCAQPCLAPKTRILMADGTHKQIQHVVRGDLVACELDGSRVMKVSQVKKNGYLPEMVRDMYVFAPGSIIGNTGELRMTEYHPIMYAGARREARAFRGVPGVEHFSCPVKVVMDPDNTGNHALYDLQFDVEGQYVAEGAVVQSRSPYYTYDPLPKAMYYDQSLYRDVRTFGTIDHPVPMDNTPIVWQYAAVDIVPACAVATIL